MGGIDCPGKVSFKLPWAWQEESETLIISHSVEVFRRGDEGAAKGVTCLLTKTLDDIPTRYSIHIWLDADRFREGDEPVLLDRIGTLVKSLDNAKEKDSPMAFDFPNAHVLIQRYTPYISRRIFVVSARWVEVI